MIGVWLESSRFALENWLGLVHVYYVSRLFSPSWLQLLSDVTCECQLWWLPCIFDGSCSWSWDDFTQPVSINQLFSVGAIWFVAIFEFGMNLFEVRYGYIFVVISYWIIFKHVCMGVTIDSSNHLNIVFLKEWFWIQGRRHLGSAPLRGQFKKLCGNWLTFVPVIFRDTLLQFISITMFFHRCRGHSSNQKLLLGYSNIKHCQKILRWGKYVLYSQARSMNICVCASQ